MSDNRARAEREVGEELGFRVSENSSIVPYVLEFADGERRALAISDIAIPLWQLCVSLKEREIEGEQTGECVHPYRRVLIDWRDQTTECTLCGKKLL